MNTSEKGISRMNTKRKFRRSSLLVVILAYVLCAGAARQDKDANEKLLDAIRNADPQATRALLSIGADANAKDDDGLTALMYAAMYAQEDCVGLLLAKGADPKSRSKTDVTALMLAVGDVRKLKLLLAKGAEINAKSKQGHTALSIAAAREGSAEVVKLLLDYGADLSSINSLAAAAENGNLQVVKYLLEKGADPNDKNKLGGVPPDSEKRANDLIKLKDSREPPLRMGVAAMAGASPLMYAALGGHAEIIKLLHERGADINARTTYQGTPLMLAAQMGQLDAVRLLLEKGADRNAKDRWGYTALMYAAASGSDDPELIKSLLARDVVISVKSNDGETALTLALRKGRTEIVRLLEQAVARK